MKNKKHTCAQEGNLPIFSSNVFFFFFCFSFSSSFFSSWCLVTMQTADTYNDGVIVSSFKKHWTVAYKNLNKFMKMLIKMVSKENPKKGKTKMFFQTYCFLFLEKSSSIFFYFSFLFFRQRKRFFFILIGHSTLM